MIYLRNFIWNFLENIKKIVFKFLENKFLFYRTYSLFLYLKEGGLIIMIICKDLILERLEIICNKFDLVQRDSSERTKLFELKNSEDFNLVKFRIELLKSRYSNEFVDEDNIEELNFNQLLLLHLRRVYLNNNQYSILIKFIKRDSKNLLVFIELINKIVYDDSGREYFI